MGKAKESVFSIIMDKRYGIKAVKIPKIRSGKGKNLINFLDRILPKPENKRREKRIIEKEYIGWSRKSINFCIREISMKRYDIPIKVKYK